MIKEREISSTDSNKDCRRKRLRVPYLAAVDVLTAHGAVIKGSLRDISLLGMFVKAEKLSEIWVKPGTATVSTLSISQGKSKLTISIPGEVARCDAGGFAVIFTEALKWWPIFILFPITDQFLFDIVAEI